LIILVANGVLWLQVLYDKGTVTDRGDETVTATTDVKRDGLTVTLLTSAGRGRKRDEWELKLGDTGAAVMKPVNNDGARVTAQRVSRDAMLDLIGAEMRVGDLTTEMKHEPERPAELRGRRSPGGWKERVIGRLDIDLEDACLKVVVEARLIAVEGSVARLRAYAEFKPLEEGENWAPKPLTGALEAMSVSGSGGRVRVSRSGDTDTVRASA
jgi:hypothetical protein